MESFLLRLVSSELTAGRVAGTLEVVRTGRVVRVASLDELRDALLGCDVPGGGERAGAVEHARDGADGTAGAADEGSQAG